MRPRFSVVITFGGEQVGRLDACIASVTAQSFDDWELCACGDLAGIPARRTGRALVEAPSGEFVALVQGADRLDPMALAATDDALSADDLIDVVYTDEELVEEHGEVIDTFLKPDWSPERLRSHDYLGNLLVVRRSLFVDIGGSELVRSGSSRHDLALRVTERARRVHHVPEVLYSRHLDGAASRDGGRSPGLVEADGDAVADHLRRAGIPGTVEKAPGATRLRVRRRVDDRPLVSVVVPTVGTARAVWGIERPLIYGCLQSLLQVTDYPRLEVIVVVDPSTPSDVVATLKRLDVTLVPADDPFNFSSRINLGAAQASGLHLLLLNDDVLIEQPDWLTTMVGFTHDADVGAVGARLLYADGTLQHAGIVCNVQPLHIFNGFAADDPGPFGLLQVDREVSAVTGACLLTPRAVFDEIGGLPEHFAVAFNDLEYCLRLRATGRRIVWTPHATLYHFESQTRGRSVSQAEIDELYARWHDELHHDPYGNPNFAPRQAVWLPSWAADASEDLRRRLRNGGR